MTTIKKSAENQNHMLKKRLPEEPPAIPENRKTNPNKYENEFMMNLMILRNTLAKNSTPSRERARLAGKYVWRDIRLAYTLVCRIQEAMLRTMPDRRRDYYTEYALRGHYELHMTGPVRTERYLLVSDRNLAALCEAVMENECLMCLKDGSEIRQCPIRKAMMEVAPPGEVEKDDQWMRCEYQNAAGQLVRGEDVKI